jgi:carboxyl-terminal processing protease
MNKKSFFIGLATGTLLVCLVFLGLGAYNTRVRWEGLPSPDAKVQEIIGLLERYSIIPFEREELMTGMYRGLLDAVGDPYTQYFDSLALEAFQMRTEGVLAGIGVMSIMNPDSNMLTVLTVFEGSPAYAAGLLEGDKIESVNGINMVGQPQNEITDMIRGPVGTTVRLTVLRPNEERYFDVEIVRALVEVPSVSYEMLPANVGLIRIDTFDRATLPQFNAALEALTAHGMAGLILDVRNNPGGLMPVVVHIANQFVPQGIITYTEHADGRREYHHATEEYLGLPLAVLVNERSASASEILSAAIQDTGAGIIVGTQTFGKGIVQNLMYLSDGNAIKLTIAKYFTPKGTSIHGVGITPNFIVEMDEHLNRRIGALPLEEDVQLLEALRIVGGYTLPDS